jgi:hypothetical protein
LPTLYYDIVSVRRFCSICHQDEKRPETDQADWPIAIQMARHAIARKFIASFSKKAALP